jgi:hypothetical protein
MSPHAGETSIDALQIVKVSNRVEREKDEPELLAQPEVTAVGKNPVNPNSPYSSLPLSLGKHRLRHIQPRDPDPVLSHGNSYSPSSTRQLEDRFTIVPGLKQVERNILHNITGL